MLNASLTETRTAHAVRRTLRIADKEIWWEITGPEDVLPSELTVHDMAVTAAVFIGMQRGEPIHIDGPVSVSMLESVEDLIASWVNLRPDLYKPIGVTAKEEVLDALLPAPPKGLAVAAFSGGLDASFTAWRHANARAGKRSRKLLAGVLIQGFDVPLDAGEAFATTCDTARDTLDSIGVPMVIVRTNWKRDTCTAWEMEFGAAVATCLRNWQGSVDTALLGSDEDYLRLVMPWGGNPMTYAMLSSSGFKVVYDGGEFARTEKAEGISDWDAGLRNLRVCWQGPITGRNCGVCEKCLRTKMNFMAVGANLPASLSGQPTNAQIRRIRVRNAAQLALLREISHIAKARGIDSPWVGALDWTISKNDFMIRSSVVSVLNRRWEAFKTRYRKIRNAWRAAQSRQKLT